jgi:hypothetical protein
VAPNDESPKFFYPNRQVSGEFFPGFKNEQNLYRSFPPSRIVLKRFLMLLSALGIFMLVAGCTAPAPSPTNTSQHNLSEQKNVTEPIPEQTQYLLVTPLVPSTARTINQTTPTRTPAAEPSLRGEIDPYISNLAFKDYYVATDIPGCDMKEIFPAFANDFSALWLHGFQQSSSPGS